MLCGMTSTCIDPEVKSQRSRLRGYENRHGRMVASVWPCTAAVGVGLLVVRLFRFLVVLFCKTKQLEIITDPGAKFTNDLRTILRQAGPVTR